MRAGFVDGHAVCTVLAVGEGMLEFIIIVSTVILDQLTKWWASASLATIPTGSLTLLPGILELRYVENRGAAFSMMWGKTSFFITVSAIVVTLLTFYLIRYRASENLITRIAIASVIGGALGNMIDRIFHGYVVDMINPLFVRFAVFNVADIFVTCGTILLVFLLAFVPFF